MSYSQFTTLEMIESNFGIKIQLCPSFHEEAPNLKFIRFQIIHHVYFSANLLQQCLARIISSEQFGKLGVGNDHFGRNQQK